MNLKPRFLLLTILLFLGSAVAGWWSVRTLAESILAQWATHYAEKQALYDKSRTLQPILREVALSRQFANARDIREWARQPDDPARMQRALMDMESYRQSFHDRSYFVALLKNGRYYFNNAQDEYSGREFRYILDPEKKKDAWFYDLICQGRDLHINVNPDPALGITKLWIDVLIRDGDEILGIAGTGLDLTGFIRGIEEEQVEGVTSLFVDHKGAIQLHRNPSLIDFGSISKQSTEQNTINLLFDLEADRRAVRNAMQALTDPGKRVITEFVSIDGRRHLAGITYLPEIDWYEITLLDLDTLLPFSQFTGILLVYAATLLAALILLNLILNRLVLNPLARLDQAMQRLQSDETVPESLAQQGSGEIRRLMQGFTRMARAVAESRYDLEQKVRQRTLALDRLTKIDPLTELLNRRGMTEQIESDLQRAHREGSAAGVLWLDVDWFKGINDRHGHAVGDQALTRIAEAIIRTIRPYDIASRWGGDEFLVLMQPSDQETLEGVAQRLCQAVGNIDDLTDRNGNPIRLSVSIGGHLARPDEPLDDLLRRADEALYAAKAAGRGCFRSTGVVAVAASLEAGP